MDRKAFFVAATGQNVGKTTTCLGLVSGLQKRVGSIGFMKAVGQEHVVTESGALIDKDVALFKSRFGLEDPYEEMSPVLFPRGFTKAYLDGKIEHGEMVNKIVGSYEAMAKKRKMIVVEGTGHTGVGSIVDLNNAQVAHLLKCPVILVASGGLGSSFDELALNKTQCERYGARVAGVILNRVFEDKRDMIQEYMGKALKKWGVPILGCIPFDELLSLPTMYDFSLLFQTELLSGEEHKYRHFHHIRLAASPLEMQSNADIPNQLLICPASREDVILSTLTQFWDLKIAKPEADLETGMILTGKIAPKKQIVDEIRRAGIPMLFAPVSSFAAMKMVNSYTAKIREEDTVKIEEAIQVVEAHIDFDLLLHSINAR
jgi:BioD-like phosphotransacetylase family protein